MKSIILSAFLVFALIIPQVVLAGDSDDTENAVKPTVVEYGKDNVLITFSGEVKDKDAATQELDAILQGISSGMGGGGGYTDGSSYLEDAEEANYGNSYVRGWLGTSVSWDYSNVGAGGSTSSAWFGTLPSSNCDAIEVYNTVSNSNGSWSSVPSGWTNNYYTAQGYYLQYNTWYVGTSWSGLSGSHGIPTVVGQNTNSVFYFNNGSINVIPNISQVIWF